MSGTDFPETEIKNKPAAQMYGRLILYITI